MIWSLLSIQVKVHMIFAAVKKIARRKNYGQFDRQKNTCTWRSWPPQFWTIWSMPYMFMHRTSPADTECRMWRSATTISAYFPPIYSMTLWTEKRHDYSCRFPKTLLYCFIGPLLVRPTFVFIARSNHMGLHPAVENLASCGKRRKSCVGDDAPFDGRENHCPFVDNTSVWRLFLAYPTLRSAQCAPLRSQ